MIEIRPANAPVSSKKAKAPTETRPLGASGIEIRPKSENPYYAEQRPIADLTPSTPPVAPSPEMGLGDVAMEGAKGLARGGLGLAQSIGGAGVEMAGQLSAGAYDLLRTPQNFPGMTPEQLTEVEAARAAVVPTQNPLEGQGQFAKQVFPADSPVIAPDPRASAENAPYLTTSPGIPQLARLAGEAGEMAPNAAATIGAAVATGGLGPAGALAGGAMGGGLEGLSEYQQVLDKGGSPVEALRAAAVMGAGAGALNAIPFVTYSTKFLPPSMRGTAARAMLSFIAEGSTETAEGGVSAIARMKKLPKSQEEWAEAYSKVERGIIDESNVFLVAGLMGGGTAIAAGGEPTIPSAGPGGVTIGPDTKSPVDKLEPGPNAPTPTPERFEEDYAPFDLPAQEQAPTAPQEDEEDFEALLASLGKENAVAPSPEAVVAPEPEPELSESEKQAEADLLAEFPELKGMLDAARRSGPLNDDLVNTILNADTVDSRDIPKVEVRKPVSREESLSKLIEERPALDVGRPLDAAVRPEEEGVPQGPARVTVRAQDRPRPGARPTSAVPSPEVRATVRGPEPVPIEEPVPVQEAEFVGLQERPRGQAPIALYNIPTPDGGKTTVTAETAKSQGFSVPEPPAQNTDQRPVYRAELPEIGEGKQLGGVQDIGSVMGIKARPPRAPFEFFTYDKEDADHYGKRDGQILESYKKKFGDDAENAFETLHGFKPRSEYSLKEEVPDTSKTLDLTGIGDKPNQSDLLEVVNKILGFPDLPKDWRQKDIPQEVEDTMEKYGLLHLGDEDGNFLTWELFRNNQSAIGAALHERDKNALDATAIQGNLFAQFLEDHGYSSVRHMHNSSRGPIEHFVKIPEGMEYKKYDMKRGANGLAEWMPRTETESLPTTQPQEPVQAQSPVRAKPVTANWKGEGEGGQTGDRYIDRMLINQIPTYPKDMISIEDIGNGLSLVSPTGKGLGEFYIAKNESIKPAFSGGGRISIDRPVAVLKTSRKGVEHIAVLPEFQRRGLSQILLGKAKDLGRDVSSAEMATEAGAAAINKFNASQEQPTPPVRATEIAPEPEVATEAIRAAAIDLAGGKTGTRVRLADLREKLGGTPAQQDTILKQMQADGELVLMRNDDPQDITPRDEAAKLMMGENRRDLVYLKPEKPAPEAKPEAPKAAAPSAYSPETQAIIDIYGDKAKALATLRKQSATAAKNKETNPATEKAIKELTEGPAPQQNDLFGAEEIQASQADAKQTQIPGGVEVIGKNVPAEYVTIPGNDALSDFRADIQRLGVKPGGRFTAEDLGYAGKNKPPWIRASGRYTADQWVEQAAAAGLIDAKDTGDSTALQRLMRGKQNERIPVAPARVEVPGATGKAPDTGKPSSVGDIMKGMGLTAEKSKRVKQADARLPKPRSKKAKVSPEFEIGTPIEFGQLGAKLSVGDVLVDKQGNVFRVKDTGRYTPETKNAFKVFPHHQVVDVAPRHKSGSRWADRTLQRDIDALGSMVKAKPGWEERQEQAKRKPTDESGYVNMALLNPMEALRILRGKLKDGKFIEFEQGFMGLKDLKVARSGKIKSLQMRGKLIAQDFENAWRKEWQKQNPGIKAKTVRFRDMPAETVEALNDYLVEEDAGVKAQLLSELPEGLRRPATQMRDLVDQMSQELIDMGIVEDDVQKVIADQMGFYLRRTYAIFQDPKYRDNIPKAVEDNARKWLREKFPTYTTNQIESALADLKGVGSEKEALNRLVQMGGVLGKLDRRTLGKRNEYDQAILDLWGVDKNGIDNFLNTINAQAHMIANFEWLEDIKANGRGSVVLTPQDIAALPQGDERSQWPFLNESDSRKSVSMSTRPKDPAASRSKALDKFIAKAESQGDAGTVEVLKKTKALFEKGMKLEDGKEVVDSRNLEGASKYAEQLQAEADKFQAEGVAAPRGKKGPLKAKSRVAQSKANKINRQIKAILEAEEQKGNADPDTFGPFGPLAGARVHPEFKAALQEAVQIQELWGPLQKLNWLNSQLKQNVTTRDPASALRNFRSGIDFSMANGWMLYKPKSVPKRLERALSIANVDIRRSHDPELREEYLKMVEYGIAGDTAVVGELNEIQKEAKKWELAKKAEKLFTPEVIKALGGTDALATKLYQAGDDVFKIFGALTEQEHLMEATGMDSDAALKEGAARVRRQFPTYSELHKILQKFRRTPFIGPFVAYQSEVPRNAWNTIAQMATELKSKNPKVRAMGWRRAAGIMWATTNRHMYKAAWLALLGLTADDDDRIRHGLAEYYQGHEFAITKGDKATGKYLGYNMSQADAYGPLKEAFWAAMRGDNIIDAAGDAIKAFGGGYVSPQLGTQAVVDLFTGKDARGNDIYLKTDDAGEAAVKVLLHASGYAAPSPARRQAKAETAEEHLREVFGTLTGYRFIEIDLPESLFWKAKDFKKYGTEQVRDAYTAARDGDTEAARKQLTDLEAVRKDYFDELQEAYIAFRDTGLNQEIMDTKLKEAGLSGKEIEAVKYGTLEPYTPPQKLTDMMK